MTSRGLGSLLISHRTNAGAERLERAWERLAPATEPDAGFLTMHEPQKLQMQQVLSRLTELLLSRAS